MVPGPDGQLYDDTTGYYDDYKVFHPYNAGDANIPPNAYTPAYANLPKPYTPRRPKPRDQRHKSDNPRWLKSDDKKYDWEKVYVPKNDDQELLDWEGHRLPKIGNLPTDTFGHVLWDEIPKEQWRRIFDREHAMRIYSTRQLKNKIYYKNKHIHLLEEYRKAAEWDFVEMKKLGVWRIHSLDPQR